MSSHERIDFKQVAQAALNSAEQLVAEWYPHGKRNGHEWRAGDVLGGEGDSFSVNLTTGMWADFAGDDKGGDLVSLYAARFGVSMLDAGRAIAQRLGLSFTAHTPMPPAVSAQKLDDKKRTAWEPIVPVPADAPPHPVAHIKRGKPTATWHYKNAEQQLLGVVMRFATSDGGKEVLPVVYARNTETGAHDWRWMQWSEPRPLYGLDRFDAAAKLTVVVEGEKKVDAGYSLLAGRVNFVAWSGGCKAYTKADWQSLTAEKVVIWPDHDEVGKKAAEGIAKLLTRAGKKVRMMNIPADLPPAWDLADAVQDGWDAQRIWEFIKSNLGETVVDEPAPVVAESSLTQRDAGAEQGQSASVYVSWKSVLHGNDKGVAKDVWQNVLHVLTLHDVWRGVLAYDEFANRVVARRETPWRKTGEWQDRDDNELSLWLASKCSLLIKQPGTVALGVIAAAQRNRFNPVQEWLQSLKWDGVRRLKHWLHECCGTADNEYVALVGTLFLRGMVKRALQPGCKMDNSIILIGAQGAGKSTVWSTLGGDWFADTPFKPGDKDSYMMVQGAWLYELSELEQFNKAETTAIKAFSSSTTDRFRLPYGRSIGTFPRVCVFGGTTNNHEIFKDHTGNRRFWPAEIVEGGDGINIAKLAEWRNQLFAEAMHDIQAGERSWPSQLEAFRLIEPECRKYEVADAWADEIESYLTDNTLQYVTVKDVLDNVLKLSLRDLQSPRGAETRIGQIMSRFGWRKRRIDVLGKRKWVYQRPAPALSGGVSDAGHTEVNMEAVDDLPI